MKVMVLQVSRKIAAEISSANLFHYYGRRGHRCCKHFTFSNSWSRYEYAYVRLLLGELILGYSNNLRKFLQNLNLWAGDGWCTTNATVETLKSIRIDEFLFVLTKC